MLNVSIIRFLYSGWENPMNFIMEIGKFSLWGFRTQIGLPGSKSQMLFVLDLSYI